MQKIVVHESECGQRVDRFISKYFKQLPFAKIQKMLREKDIRVNEQKVAGSYRLAAGDEIRIFV